MTRLEEQARQDWKRHLRQVWPGCGFGMHRQSVGSLFGLIVCVIDMRTWTVQGGREKEQKGHLAVAFPFLIKVHSSLNFSWQFNRDIITPRQLRQLFSSYSSAQIMLNASANGSWKIEGLKLMYRLICVWPAQAGCGVVWPRKRVHRWDTPCSI